MLSLGFLARPKHAGQARSPVNFAEGSRRVLPRVLRKPARAFNRLLSGDVTISPRGWVSIGALGVVAILIGTFANSRQGYTIAGELSAHFGFTIDSVAVEGIGELSQIDVLTRLDLGPSKSLFAFDIVRARESLRQLPWVKDVVVAKAYPDKLLVKITERQPFAIWQRGSSLGLIERNGKSIDAYDAQFSALPLLVGKGANIHGAQIIYQTSNNSALKGRIKAYVRVGDRRWDLRLKNGMTIRLPGNNLAATLGQISALANSHDILSRDISLIDLRLDDRVVFALGEHAMQMRAARMKNLTQLKKEKKI